MNAACTMEGRILDVASHRPLAARSRPYGDQQQRRSSAAGGNDAEVADMKSSSCAHAFPVHGGPEVGVFSSSTTAALLSFEGTLEPLATATRSSSLFSSRRTGSGGDRPAPAVLVSMATYSSTARPQVDICFLVIEDSLGR